MTRDVTDKSSGTADLADQHGSDVVSCETQFRQFGKRMVFSGSVTTIRCHEDNAILKTVIMQNGHGRVVVVDSDGSLHCAMLGDNMARVAMQNGWEGIVVHGAVRDAAALRGIDIGIKALGTNPRRSLKLGTGRLNVPVSIGSAIFRPGDRLVSDEDGIVLLPEVQSTYQSGRR